MQYPANDLVPSPTNSSISSSDLDTESTGSFFHDRSTTLGTLMGVSFPPPSHPCAATAAAVGRSRTTVKSKRKAAIALAKWWPLCRDDDSRPASLREYFELERRSGDGAFYGTVVELEGMVMDSQQRNHGRTLFADGIVLPPSVIDDGPSTAGRLCNRFPVSLTGICSSGAG